MNKLFIVFSDIVQVYKKELMIITALVVVGIAALYFYSDWKVQIDQSAQIAFSNTLENFQKAMQEGTGDWQDLELQAEHNFTQHSNSRLAPYFLAMQAEALVEQNKISDAISIMEKMVSKISVGSPFYYLFQIKLARLKFSLDSTQQEGYLLLQKLAENSKNPYQDEALFYLGKVYAQQQDYEKARALWNQLIYNFNEESMLGKSPWVEQAQQQLQKLPSKFVGI